MGRPYCGEVAGLGMPQHSSTAFHSLFQKLSTEELAGLKSSLAHYFVEGPGKASGVTCLYFVEEGRQR